MFRIKDFRANINTKGVLKTNKYIASISFPATGDSPHYMAKYSQDQTKMFSLRCEAIQLPGVALASADGPPRYGYGPIEKHPYSVNFEDLSLTFICDANSQIHSLFYNWVNTIVNFQGRGGNSIREALGPNAKANAYEVGYRDRYCTTLQIDVYKDSGNDDGNIKSMTFKAYNAFPMSFPSNGLNWNDGEVLRLTIPFAYTDYSVEYAKVAPIN